MKNIKYIIGLFLSLTLLFSSCEKAVDKEFGDIIAPSNIQITAEIVGQDEANPYGDGTGTVNFTATANDVISFKFVYDGVEAMAPAGTKTYNFGKTGLFKYSVTVVAIGTAGVTSSASIEVDVLALYAPPADLLTMLTSNSSRTWRIAAEDNLHFGLGPVGGAIPFEWYGAPANAKDGLGMYDDRFVFDIDGTFTHTTNGDIYGKADPMALDLGGDQGLTPNSDQEFSNYPFSNYSEKWELTAPGGVETLSLTNLGFIAFYIGGSHQYKIYSRSENEMILRTTDWNNSFDWWFLLVPAE